MKLVKFGTAGIFNTGVDWGLYFLLTHAVHWGVTASKLAGSLGGISSAFLLNALWVFGEYFRPKYSTFNSRLHKIHFVGTKYLQSVMIYSLGLCVNVAVFSTVIRQGMMELPALLFATGCSFMINFLLSKRFVFAPGPEQRSR